MTWELESKGAFLLKIQIRILERTFCQIDVDLIT